MSIFTQVRQEHPESIVWQNDNYFVLKDIHPQAPTHLLVIPKKETPTLADLSEGEMGELINTAIQVAKEMGLTAYYFHINVNKPYQEIFHVHVHLESDQPIK